MAQGKTSASLMFSQQAHHGVHLPSPGALEAEGCFNPAGPALQPAVSLNKPVEVVLVVEARLVK